MRDDEEAKTEKTLSHDKGAFLKSSHCLNFQEGLVAVECCGGSCNVVA